MDIVNKKNNLKYGYSLIRKLWHLLLRRPNGRQTKIVGRFTYHGTKNNTPKGKKSKAKKSNKKK